MARSNSPDHSTTPRMPRSAASARWRSAPLRAASVRACSSSAAPPRRSAAGATASISATIRARVGLGLAAVEVEQRAAEPVAHRAPAVLDDAAVVVDRQRLAGVVALGEPRDQPGGERDHARCILHRGLAVGHAQLDRAHLVVRRAARTRARRRRGRRRRGGPSARTSARSSHEPHAGGTPWRGSRSQSFGPQRGEAGVAPGVQRRVAGQRGELGEVGAQRVVDRERAVGAADGDVHVQPEHELAREHPRELLDQVRVLRVVDQLALGVGERVRAGARQPRPALDAGSERAARIRQRGGGLGDRGAHRRGGLDLRGGQLGAQRDGVAELGAHARGGRQQVERLGVEQHQLLLDADREIGHAVEQGAPAVRVEHPGATLPAIAALKCWEASAQHADRGPPRGAAGHPATPRCSAG